MSSLKLYKIRDKKTGDFITAGCSGRSSWRQYPTLAIEYNSGIKNHKEDYEVVVYELVETHIEPLR